MMSCSHSTLLFSNCVCSSENIDGGKGHAHKEVMSTVAEMKKRLPSDKRSRSKASTVEALHYALNCVKQVQGDMSSDTHHRPKPNGNHRQTHFLDSQNLINAARFLCVPL